jgi:5-methylcytosine-specific restriction endonuclease McrA
MATDFYAGIYGKTKRQPVGRSQKTAVRISQKGRCYDCGKVLVIEEHHHVKHVSAGGKSTTGNLVALCPECHRKRHIKEQAMKLDKKRNRKSSSSFVAGYNPKSLFR